MTPIFPKSISDVRYRYRTSNIHIRRPISISDVRYLYPMSDIQYPTSARASARARARASARARARAGISDIGYRYWTSNIDIGRRIYILDVRYIYILDIQYKLQKHVLNGASYPRAPYGTIASEWGNR